MAGGLCWAVTGEAGVLRVGVTGTSLGHLFSTSQAGLVVVPGEGPGSPPQNPPVAHIPVWPRENPRTSGRGPGRGAQVSRQR